MYYNRGIENDTREEMVMLNKMYNLCVKNSWFTCGTNSQYDKLFEMVREGRTAEELALVIWVCSDGWLLDDICARLHEAGFPRLVYFK